MSRKEERSVDGVAGVGVGFSVDVVGDVGDDVTVFCRCRKERQVGDSAFTIGDVTVEEVCGFSIRGIDLMQSRRRSRLLDLYCLTSLMTRALQSARNAGSYLSAKACEL